MSLLHLARPVELASVCILIGITSACAHATRTLSDTHAAAMKDSVEDALTRFRRYSATRQWDSLMTMYADDPRFRTRIVFSEASTFEFGGAITMTMIHQADGWRILGGHTSSPIPRPR